MLSGLLNLCFCRFRIEYNFLTTQRKPHSAICFTHWGVFRDICDVFLASTGCCHSTHTFVCYFGDFLIPSKSIALFNFCIILQYCAVFVAERDKIWGWGGARVIWVRTGVASTGWWATCHTKPEALNVFFDKVTKVWMIYLKSERDRISNTRFFFVFL